ncbi:MAG: SDR family oxidoreductase [Gemmatimonadota bacterium]
MGNTDRQAVLILGASSGFGEAAALEFARADYDIIGVHLDRRAGMSHVGEIRDKVEGAGVEADFHNMNAASSEKRDELLDDLAGRRAPGSIRMMLHSLAFGTLRPLVSQHPTDAMTPDQMDMTLAVMAHSLIYWTQGIVTRGLMGQGGRIYAMTSSGGDRVIPSYGGVSAAKAALESHTRQLSLELAPFGITANAIRAGVTDTPALRKIPGAEQMIDEARRQNPYGRLTTPEDVARCLLALCDRGTDWMTGNTIRVDGGEDFVGSMPSS